MEIYAVVRVLDDWKSVYAMLANCIELKAILCESNRVLNANSIRIVQVFYDEFGTIKNLLHEVLRRTSPDSPIYLNRRYLHSQRQYGRQ